MSIKQTMSTPVAQDSAGVAAVVNEATDGTKSVLTELATKNADDSGFTQVSEANPLPVTGAVQLTGSIVDEDYEGGVVKTRTMGLAWRAFDLFGGNVTVPAGTYVDIPIDVIQVNGFSTLGIIARDVQSGAVGRHEFTLHVYWQGQSGNFYTGYSTNEVFTNAVDSTGMALSTATKSEFVGFRLFNRSDIERTYYCKGLLRA